MNPEKNDKSNAGKKGEVKIDRRSRSLKIYSIGSVGVLIVALLLFNLLYDTVLKDKTIWDLTDTGMYTLSDATVELIDQLENDVEIVGLFERDADAERAYEDFLPLLDQYERISDGKITVRYIDPEIYPSILRELDPDGTLKPTVGSFVIRSGDRARKLNPYDCYILDVAYYQSTGQMVATANTVEYSFSGAIYSVAVADPQKVYFTTNYGEASRFELERVILSNGYDVGTFSSLTSDRVPDDCELLIINNPSRDIFEQDIDVLNDYISRGKNLIVISSFDQTMMPFDNLNEVLRNFNLRISQDRVNEKDLNYRLDSTSGYLFYADLIPNSLFDRSGVIKAARIENARAIVTADSARAYITTEIVLATSEQGVIEFGGDPDQTGVIGRQPIAQYAVNSGYLETASAWVIGTDQMTSDAFIQLYSPQDQNVQIFTYGLNKMLGVESPLEIDVQQFPSYVLENLPSANAQTIWSIVMIAGVPLVLFAGGLLTYNKRKNL